MKYISLFLLLSALVGCFAKDPLKTGLEGNPLPSFNLLLADSITHFNTSKIPTGRPIVLFYFGPHCPYSRAQMDNIVKDMAILKDIRFYIFTSYSFGEMKSFYNHYQLKKYLNITTGVDTENFFGNYFEARGVPYLAIYNKDKRLNKAFIGKMYGSQIKEVAEE